MKKVLLLRLNLSSKGRVIHPSHCVPPFTLKYLESLLKCNGRVEVELIDAMIQNLTFEQIIGLTVALRPCFIVLQINSVNLRSSMEYISVVRQKIQSFIIGIGSIGSRFASTGMDVFIPGEGEKETAGLINRLLNNQTTEKEEIDRYRGTSGVDPRPCLVEDLDSLPVPAYSQMELAGYQFIYPIRAAKKLVWGHILTSRGCPFPCSFCSPVTRESYGRDIRLRSAASVVNEIEVLIGRGVNIISFDDDLFTVNRKHVKDICREILSRGLEIHWIAHSRVDTVDYELLKEMKMAGCALLRFGIESGSTRIVKLLRKTSAHVDWHKKAKEVFVWARSLNIATHALLIIGSPTETEEDIKATYDFIKNLDPDSIQIHFFNPYPGSKDYENYSEILTNDTVMDMHHYVASRFTFGEVNFDKLQKIRNQFYLRILLAPKFLIRHTIKYFFFYANNLDIFFRLFRGAKALVAH